MKKQTIKGLAFIVVAGAMASSCEMLKDVTYEVTPKTLEMHGDSVRISIEATLPPKGIKKKVSVDIQTGRAFDSARCDRLRDHAKIR